MHGLPCPHRLYLRLGSDTVLDYNVKAACHDRSQPSQRRYPPPDLMHPPLWLQGYMTSLLPSTGALSRQLQMTHVKSEQHLHLQAHMLQQQQHQQLQHQQHQQQQQQLQPMFAVGGVYRCGRSAAASLPPA